MKKLDLLARKLKTIHQCFDLKIRFVKTAAKEEPDIKIASIYRYNPEGPDKKPRMKKYEINLKECKFSVLDLLGKIKSEIDPTLAYRHSCHEGICGSCAMNIDGVNRLACITRLDAIKRKTFKIYPLPHMYVIKDLVVDMNKFYEQYKYIEPWLQTEEPVGQRKELRQSIEERDKLEGLYECILCACCTTSCPQYWWNSIEGFLGPAAILNAYRWLVDSRDQGFENRLKKLRNKNSVFKCKTIANCSVCCPKHLNPAKSIAEVKKLLVGWEKKHTTIPAKPTVFP